MTRAALVIIASSRQPGRPRSTVLGDPRDALEQAGFKVGEKVSVVLTTRLEALLEAEWKYKDLG